MYGSAQAPEDSDRTAFRKAEKKYKLYKSSDIKKKKNNNKSSSERQDQAKEVDLSEVVDFKSVLESFNQNGETPNGIFELQSDFDRPVFCLKDRPGFYFIPGALSIEEQCHWIRESLRNFPQPPNRTNHNAIYGPIHDLFLASQRQKYLVEVETSVADEESTLNSSVSNGDGHRWQCDEEIGVATSGESCKAVAASALLRKLRWSTLGLQFDWSKRNYNISLPHNKIPEKLSLLAKRMARPAMPTGEEFQSEAAIVNYFGAGDMLGGHLDDMEADWSKPIVSISLGCKAIFLLGGNSREEPPTAMFLRSGDVVLMSGKARECFHGVPRIFTDKENAEISALDSQFSHQDDLCFMEYIRTSRININIRQVF